MTQAGEKLVRFLGNVVVQTGADRSHVGGLAWWHGTGPGEVAGVAMVRSNSSIGVATSQRVRGGVDWSEQLRVGTGGHAHPGHVGPHGAGHHVVAVELRL